MLHFIVQDRYSTRMSAEHSGAYLGVVLSKPDSYSNTMECTQSLLLQNTDTRHLPEIIVVRRNVNAPVAVAK